MNRVFVLSPANCNGVRAQYKMNGPRTNSKLAKFGHPPLVKR